MRAVFLGVATVVIIAVLAACGQKEPIIQAEVAPAPAPRRAERPEREHYLGMAVPDHEPVPFPNVRGECEPGQVRDCSSQIAPLGPDGTRAHTLRMHCRLAGDGVFHFNRAECATPLVIAFDDAPIAFTHPAGAFAVGPFERTEWVSPRTPWLALDVDGSGCIEDQRELFRFDRLAALDENHDGRIDEGDPAFARLVLWFDRNQDRRCSAGEIVGLAEAGIVALDLDYVIPTDVPFGSHEGEHAAISYRTAENEVRRGRIVDVYLAPLPR